MSEEQQEQTLQFEGREYKASDLTDAARQEVHNLQQVDGMIGFHNQHVAALSITKSSFLANLREALKSVPSTEMPVEFTAEEEEN